MFIGLYGCWDVRALLMTLRPARRMRWFVLSIYRMYATYSIHTRLIVLFQVYFTRTILVCTYYTTAVRYERVFWVLGTKLSPKKLSVLVCCSSLSWLFVIRIYNINSGTIRWRATVQDPPSSDIVRHPRYIFGRQLNAPCLAGLSHLVYSACTLRSNRVVFNHGRMSSCLLRHKFP